MDVQHLHGVGQGCPDILVGYRGRKHFVRNKERRESQADSGSGYLALSLEGSGSGSV
jgi:hypothetical protein